MYIALFYDIIQNRIAFWGKNAILKNKKITRGQENEKRILNE